MCVLRDYLALNRSRSFLFLQSFPLYIVSFRSGVSKLETPILDSEPKIDNYNYCCFCKILWEEWNINSEKKNTKSWRANSDITNAIVLIWTYFLPHFLSWCSVAQMLGLPLMVLSWHCIVMKNYSSTGNTKIKQQVIYFFLKKKLGDRRHKITVAN